MKKVLIAAIILASPILGYSYNTLIINDFNINLEIPQRFMSSSETDVMEWGCPIQETVNARNSAEALEIIGNSCMEDVRKAASEKPGVFDVIQVSVIWPDIAIQPTKGGFHLEGTLFLETLIMKQAGEGQ